LLNHSLAADREKLRPLKRLLGVSIMNQEDERQIEQLWMVAKAYYDLATSLKDYLPDDQLKLTVREFADQCQDLTCLQQNKNLVLASAHLASSAIRLYSIDELQKDNSIHWSKYYGILGSTDSNKARELIHQQIGDVVHFLLRHMVAHSEDEWKDNMKYAIAFKALEEMYFDLTYEKIFSLMDNLINSMKKIFSPNKANSADAKNRAAD